MLQPREQKWWRAIRLCKAKAIVAPSNVLYKTLLCLAMQTKVFLLLSICERDEDQRIKTVVLPSSDVAFHVEVTDPVIICLFIRNKIVRYPKYR